MCPVMHILVGAVMVPKCVWGSTKNLYGHHSYFLRKGWSGPIGSRSSILWESGVANGLFKGGFSFFLSFWGKNGPHLSYLSNSFSMSPTCSSIPKLLKFGYRPINQTRFENILKDVFNL
jgi:hypothetical protein